MSVLHKGIAIGFEVRMKTTDSYQKSCSHIVLINLTYTHTIYIYIFSSSDSQYGSVCLRTNHQSHKNKNKNKIRTPSHDRYPTSLKKVLELLAAFVYHEKSQRRQPTMQMPSLWRPRRRHVDCRRELGNVQEEPDTCMAAGASPSIICRVIEALLAWSGEHV